MRGNRGGIVGSVVLLGLLACGSRTSLVDTIDGDASAPPAPTPLPPPACTPSNEAERAIPTPGLAPVGLTVVGGWIYFGAHGVAPVPTPVPGGVYRLPVAGGPIEQVADDYFDGELVDDGAFVYYPKVRWDPETGYPRCVSVGALPVTGGKARELPAPPPEGAVDRSFLRTNGKPGVYWTMVPWTANATLGIYHWDPATDSIERVVDLGRDGGPVFEVDDHHIYFTHGSGRSIYSVPLGGGAEQLVATNVTGRLLRSDGRSLYFQRDNQTVRLRDGHEDAARIAVESNLLEVSEPWLYYGGFLVDRSPFDACTPPEPGALCKAHEVWGSDPPYALRVKDCTVYWTASDLQGIKLRRE